MEFKKITRGVFKRSGWKVVTETEDDLISCHGTRFEENADFVAYCFNLQQKLNIAQYEEMAKALEDLVSLFQGELFEEFSKTMALVNAMNTLKKAKQ